MKDQNMSVGQRLDHINYMLKKIERKKKKHHFTRKKRSKVYSTIVQKMALIRFEKMQKKISKEV